MKEPELEEFCREVQILINRLSLENYSDTPDFILAEYLTQCLINFHDTTRKRSKWYGEETLIERNKKSLS